MLDFFKFVGGNLELQTQKSSAVSLHTSHRHCREIHIHHMQIPNYYESQNKSYFCY